MLAQYTNTPLVEVGITGFDILHALSFFMDTPGPVAVVLHEANRFRYLDDVAGTLKKTVLQKTYATEEELAVIMRALQKEGVGQVIGTSLVVDIALSLGLNA